MSDCHRQIISLADSDIIDAAPSERIGQDKLGGDIKIIIHAKTNSCADFSFDGEFSFSYGLFYWLKNYQEIVTRMWPGLESGPGSDLASVRALAPRLALLVLASANTMSGMLTGSLVTRSGVNTRGQCWVIMCQYLLGGLCGVQALLSSSASSASTRMRGCAGRLEAGSGGRGPASCLTSRPGRGHWSTWWRPPSDSRYSRCEDHWSRYFNRK